MKRTVGWTFMFTCFEKTDTRRVDMNVHPTPAEEARIPYYIPPEIALELS
jgi:hypothetical protein